MKCQILNKKLNDFYMIIQIFLHTIKVKKFGIHVSNLQYHTDKNLPHRKPIQVQLNKLSEDICVKVKCCQVGSVIALAVFLSPVCPSGQQDVQSFH